MNGRNDALENFFSAAFTFARRQYAALLHQGVSFDHQWCGVSQLAYDAKSAAKIANMLAVERPATLAMAMAFDSAALSELCGIDSSFGGITYPLGGWLCPAELTRTALQLAQRQGLICHYQHCANALFREEIGWRIGFANGENQRHATVILANGHQLTALAPGEVLPLYAVRGQVSHIPTSAALSQLKQVLSYDGYLTPVNVTHQEHCIGASYQRGATTTVYREDEQQENRTRLRAACQSRFSRNKVDVSGGQARCSIRSATRSSDADRCHVGLSGHAGAVSGFATATSARCRHRQCAGVSESVCARWAGIARAVFGAASGGNFGSATVWRTVAE